MAKKDDYATIILILAIILLLLLFLIRVSSSSPKENNPDNTAGLQLTPTPTNTSVVTPTESPPYIKGVDNIPASNFMYY